MTEYLHAAGEAVEWLAIAIDIFGVGLLLIGAFKFASNAVRIELDKVRGLACAKRIRANRMELGGYILAALEFMIVSDILHSVVSRKLEDLYFLGVLVVIRTAISYFLGRELKEIEQEDAAAD